MPDILVAACAALAVLGFFASAFLPELVGESALVRRLRLLADNAPKSSEGRTASEEVAAQLKAIEKRAKARQKVTLQAQLQQAGLKWSVRAVVLGSTAAGLMLALLLLVLLGSPLVGVIAGSAAGFVLPRWYIARSRVRRLARFSEELPNALDVMARGVLAGRPIADCVRSIAREQPEPLRSEFKLVEIHAQNSSLSEAMDRLALRVPIDETRFLAVAIGMQSADGGGISESLKNLSLTLRERLMAKKKIASLTAEHRLTSKMLAASPLLCLGMMYMGKPEQTALMWTTLAGQVTLVACAIWIIIGFIFVNRMATFKV